MYRYLANSALPAHELPLYAILLRQEKTFVVLHFLHLLAPPRHILGTTDHKLHLQHLIFKLVDQTYPFEFRMVGLNVLQILLGDG